MKHHSALLTDLYELTMIQGYLHYNYNPRVVFDMFFRRQPFNGGFTIFAGLEDLLKGLKGLSFLKDDLEYLAGLKIFSQDFLDYLANFRFKGDIYSVDEGLPVFPDEPLIRVHASLIEAQLIESYLLNVINFQTLIATKTARIYLASGKGTILEFGLRRAQGLDGALSASRAAFIGGAAATSNTMAGKIFGIPVKGTMAHSWVMSFENELEAFEKYAEVYPDECILLIDTYDTLESGLVNAINVGRRLLKEGHHNFGIRLDSGDLEYLSKKVRAEMDKAGLPEAKISVSNELDENIIHQLLTEGAPIDYWGVGTNLVTAKGDSALTGVYKLKAREKDGRFQPTIKVSNNPEKITNPGIKQVYRFFNGQGSPIADLMALDDEELIPGRSYRFHHPRYLYRSMLVSKCSRIEPLLSLKMKGGEISADLPDLKTIQQRCKENLDRIDSSYKRLLNPHIYKVSISQKLRDLKVGMIKEYSSRR